MIGLNMQEADFRNLPNNPSTGDTFSGIVDSTDGNFDTTGPTDDHTTDTTEPKQNSTVINEVILLGFDDFKISRNIFTFNVNLKKFDPDFKIRSLTFPVYIYHKKNLRFLNETQGSTCVCDDSNVIVECQCRGCGMSMQRNL